MNLKDKIVVITGGSKGFGKALTKAFLKEGSKVVISSRDKEEVKEAVMEMRVLGICADVTNEDELIFLLKATVKELGGVDIWINNAGISVGHDIAENFDMEKVRKMFEVNVFGVMNGSRVALRYMKKKGTGMIINVISDSALTGRPTSSMYCASKWAVNGFTKSIREGNKNISVLGIYPGGMKTELFGKNKPDNYNDFMETSYVAEKVIDNLKKEFPEEELIIQGPEVK